MTDAKHPELSLRDAAWVRRLAARLLVDEGAAEDVAQEALFANHVSPPPDGVVRRAWLTTITRRLAIRRARKRMEAELDEDRLPARPDEAPEAIVERAELARVVLEEVMAIEPSYRRALLEHYLEARPAVEIGRRAKLPAATIRTHLARGREALRDRLRRRLGPDWRQSLALFLPLPEVAAATTVGSPLVSLASPKVAVGGAMVVFLAVVFVGLVGDGAPARPEVDSSFRTPPGAAGEGSSSTRRDGRTLVTSPFAGTGRDGGPSAEEAAPTVVTGRLVDGAGGAPVEGARIAASRHLSGIELLRWRREHSGRRTWTAPEPAVSDAEGRFRLELTRVPRKLRLSVRKEGYARLSEPLEMPSDDSKLVELGALMMPRGAPLMVLVVDAEGRPLPGVDLSIDRVGSADDWASSGRSGRTDAFGELKRAFILPVGRHRLAVRDHEILEGPREIALHEEGEVRRVRLVVRPLDPLPAISGRVVDGRGEPVGGVSVSAWQGARGLVGRDRSTDSRGRFELRMIRRGNGVLEGTPDAPAVLSVSSQTYESCRKEEPVAWGTTDVELRLHRSRWVDLEVCSAADGRPVEDYGIWLCRGRGPENASGQFGAFRDYGRHRDGKLSIPLGRGVWRIGVEAEDASFSAAESIVVDTREAERVPARIDLPTMKEIDIRVHHADGSPAEEVILSLFREGAPEILKQKERRGWSTGPNSVAAAARPEKGSWSLELPCDAAYVLRVNSPFQVLKRVTIPREARGAIDVEIPERATLKGCVVPEAFVDNRGSVERHKAGMAQYGRGAAIVLRPREQGGDAKARSSMATDPRMHDGTGVVGGSVRVDEEGGFEVRTLPPGRWDVGISVLVPHGSGAKTFEWLLLEGVPIAPGEERELRLDCSSFVPSECRIHVRGDGGLAPGDVALVTRRSVIGREDPYPCRVTWQLDSRGVVCRELPGGTYEVYAGSPPGHGPVGHLGTIELPPGTRQRFVVPYAPVPCGLRLVAREDGSPVSDVSLVVVAPRERRSFRSGPRRGRLELPPTDATGWTRGEGLLPGRYEVKVLEPRVTSEGRSVAEGAPRRIGRSVGSIAPSRTTTRFTLQWPPEGR